MIEKKCYFYNVGTTFDKNDFEELEDDWNCNPHCCKSDLCNGLYCEDYGINFNKEETIKNIKKYVEIGVNNTYGYMKEVKISLPKDLWKDNGNIQQNVIHVLKESELDSETMKWVNDNLYYTSKENEIGGM